MSYDSKSLDLAEHFLADGPRTAGDAAELAQAIQTVVEDWLSARDARPRTWKGDDHPPGWRRVTSIDVADPANTAWACENHYRIGTIYDGGSDSAVEPCCADVYEEVDEGTAA
jgi:hypothetical protein